MKVNKRVVEIYEVEFMNLIEELRGMNVEERQVLYRFHSKKVFPQSKEIVNLEDQLSGRSDYIHKFKKSFFLVGNMFFSPNHFGDYHQENFMELTGCGSQRYPQKVILALSMLGYITKMFRSYSVGHHGYQYDVDYWKFKKWDKEFFDDVQLDDRDSFPFEVPSYVDEWLWDKQIKTLKSILVDEHVYSSMMSMKDDILGGTVSRRDLDKDELKKLSLIHDIENLYHKTDSCMRITVDGEEGRLYSIMTRMKSEYRHNGTFTIDGERFKEVDLCNSQPTLLGLMVKQKHKETHPDFHSEWLNHCLKGDFYEWVVDVTCLNDYTYEEIVSKFQSTINKNKKIKGRKEKAENDEKTLNKSLKVKSDLDTNPEPDITPDMYFKTIVRPLVKNWIMSFLYCKEKLSITRKDSKVDIQSHFNHKLCLYLEENEPLIFNEIFWHREHVKPKKKKPNETSSELARKMQEEEVRYIKQVLKNLDPQIQYLYTVHDCIGCLESDVDKVVSIMEQTSIDYYGVKLKLKVE